MSLALELILHWKYRWKDTKPYAFFQLTCVFCSKNSKPVTNFISGLVTGNVRMRSITWMIWNKKTCMDKNRRHCNSSLIEDLMQIRQVKVCCYPFLQLFLYHFPSYFSIIYLLQCGMFRPFHQQLCDSDTVAFQQRSTLNGLHDVGVSVDIVWLSRSVILEKNWLMEVWLCLGMFGYH